MDNIQDRINKLLALAQSPNENEAKLALLRARELMAKYKLSVKDLEKPEDAAVQRIYIPECAYTTLTNNWVLGLTNVIAKHYCCVSLISKKKNHKICTPVLLGLDDDVLLCEKIFRYAYDSVKSGIRRQIYRYPDETASTYRTRCNAYGHGFVKGLTEAFKTQNQSSEELALALVTPLTVQEEMDRICGRKKPIPFRYSNAVQQHMEAAAAGYNAGKNFQPERRIQGKSNERNTGFLPEAAL